MKQIKKRALSPFFYLFFLQVYIDACNSAGFAGDIEVGGGVDIGAECVIGEEGIGDIVDLRIPRGSV